jgi:hypothetical protein
VHSIYLYCTVTVEPVCYEIEKSTSRLYRYTRYAMYFTVFADVLRYTIFVSCSNVKCQMKWDRSVPGLRYGKEGVQEGGSGCVCG